ncbi:high-affinity branched-chain amino acid transport system periplasmic binding protein livK [Dinoroseobacter shibae DFL 12 = DSM 16493]|uniref:High-affinity branched-chain amino acid transport system periplasmic binding protein livK n=1 Tax=Dinoroseobacter shibae (strain DSM 16493 / NCIMB 14021 / DFL 12) TaxID=398580 RepID=A8LMY5_DINSH|nr:MULTISPECIES: ABC transporter substrate-binding protein [Dinoroseobacter]ABV92129.1 high-affinity branched-chain amino acid transport system periplasmic binding protein livK [Dinoroseobacter shibae DFL 12 = DSM 16493]MDD9718923.1 ABC transporter substrate-binding protein [Dinoroseobacter sp. PD6]URF47087.1 ABC transporter substrate-binding protein [Dinoroseobacter shibae]URF51398.1 ABC transporter substrate-binding protein [Dinoroseobacter shibae]
MKKTLTSMAVAATMVAAPVMADLVYPSLSYRTGPYAAGGIPFADGYADYFTLLNERDGGIGGVMTRVLECETGYNTQKGVECYESTKGEGSLVYQPLSTGITYQLIPKATADGIPLHTMGYGRTSAANGTVFSHVFNYPANYWDAASVAVNHLLGEYESLEGKTIALLYHNSAYGKEPIRTLEELSAKHGFELTTIAVDHPGQEQKSQWLQIRRERPDYVVMWGWGVMNQVAVQEAANIRFPMENFIGNWWAGSENDVIPAGMAADGYKSLAMHSVGDDFPIYEDLKTHVFDKGLAAGAGDQHGTVLYNRGLYAAMLAAEATRKAQEIHGVADITPAMMRDGMEALEITEARMAELGMPDFGPAFSVSCEDHGGSGAAKIQQWDADTQTWTVISDWIAPDAEVINALVTADSEAFAAENNIETRCN